MINKKSVLRFFSIMLIVLIMSGTVSASPLTAVTAGTGFTYQGKLSNGGAAVTAQCDFEFRLWDALTMGVQIGATQMISNISVVNGLFTTQLDFGANAFNGEARWLDTAVRCPAGSGGITLLAPRQPLTPAPMALSLLGLRIQQNAASPNMIGGYGGNTISPGVVGGVIGGGGTSGALNSILENYGTIGGGQGNVIGGISGLGGGTVGGGGGNTASGFVSTIAGGQYNVASNSYATVGGGGSNTASGDHATVGGGAGNTASGSHVIIGGGQDNLANGYRTTIGGGEGNTASNFHSTVAGGVYNHSSGDSATVGGGRYNTASGEAATVGGGWQNIASGQNATTPGGYKNEAVGNASFAAGFEAKANHGATFVWADGSGIDPFASTADQQFLIQATGGVGINTNLTTANNLTVNGQVIAGDTGLPAGASEPFISRGSNSGISLDDRAGGANPRWVMYPNGGTLNFWNGSNRLMIDSTGIITLGNLATAGGNPLCLNGWQIAACSSSLRYKNNIANLKLGLDTIAQLRPVTFDWKETGNHDLGFVAEEVDQVTALLTTRNANGQIEGVKYDRISAVLVNAINEQQDQIADLEARIAALEKMNNAAVSEPPKAAPTSWLGFGGLLIAGIFLTQRLRGEHNDKT